MFGKINLFFLLVGLLASWVSQAVFIHGFEAPDLPTIPFSSDSTSDRHSAVPIGSSSAAQGYYEYLPPGYEQGKQEYPLLLFIHGLGENGDGNSQLDRVLANGPPRMINSNTWNDSWPFVVLSPQRTGGGCTSSNQVRDFINFALLNYDINPARVYLSGLSCGAIGSWNYLGNNTNSQIAAVVPIAGNGIGAYNNAGCDLNLTPIWAFHGDSDGVVDVTGTTSPINNLLMNCQNPAPVDTSMVIYPGVGHNSWRRTYDLSAGHNIYLWFLRYRNENALAVP